MRSLYRGIEPIIAVVILVAVTLVLAIGVIGWIMGWWGTLGGTETLQIMPYSELYSNGALTIYVTNLGTATSYIVKAEVAGLGPCTINNCGGGAGCTTSNNIAVIPSGAECTVEFSGCGSLTAGTRYTVRIYTKAGNIYSIVLEAKAAPSQAQSPPSQAQSP
ncbi:MAG: archaellin/type IV pilin N-terminal domain-containing protein [Nitrososphaerota archaeon]